MVVKSVKPRHHEADRVTRMYQNNEDAYVVAEELGISYHRIKAIAFALGLSGGPNMKQRKSLAMKRYWERKRQC